MEKITHFYFRYIEKQTNNQLLGTVWPEFFGRIVKLFSKNIHLKMSHTFELIVVHFQKVSKLILT
jgi:hypothetical protein